MAKKNNKIDVKVYEGAIAPKVFATAVTGGIQITIIDKDGTHTAIVNNGAKGDTGDTGATFTPSVSDAGVISWTNDKSLPNPNPKNIKGIQGDIGPYFTPAVNLDGIISWTNNGGLPNPPSQNIKGPQGIQGEDGPQGPTGPQGNPGQDGQPFSIKWVAPSYEALCSDVSHCAVGEMAVIASTVQDPHNAELYVRQNEPTEHGYYKFLTDMSGAQGIEGPQGPRGIQGIEGPQGIPGQNGTDGVSVLGVSIGGNRSQYLNFALSNGAVSTVLMDNAYEYIIQEVIRRLSNANLA